MVCDWEGRWSTGAHPSVEDAAKFIAEVKRLLPENKCGLYCNTSDWTSTAVKAGDFLWIAEYGTKAPNIKAVWDFWQFTNVPIDTNLSRFEALPELKVWALSSSPPLKPPKPPQIPPPDPAHPKPEHGSKNTWVRVDADGTINPQGRFLLTTRGLAMYLEAGRLYRQAGGGKPPLITQGGRSNAVGASAGTHGREAMDWSTRSLTGTKTRLWELCLWLVGFAAWTRTEIPRLWVKHTHGVPKGGDLSSEAAAQVRDFKNARNGLAGHGGYPRITKAGVADWTWEDYLAGWGVSLSALQSAYDTGKANDDVKDLQWALSRHLGTDVIGDGQLGPQTRAALAKVGPLNEETLTKLGLEVNP
jgi:hypothetical protein